MKFTQSSFPFYLLGFNTVSKLVCFFLGGGGEGGGGRGVDVICT